MRSKGVIRGVSESESGSRSMIADKCMSPAEAVKRFVKDGSQVVLGGFTITRNPMAIVHEIIRQGVKDLHLVQHSHGMGLDLLIGAGCVKRLEIAYGGNGRFAPTCIRFRKAVCHGQIEVEDYTNYHMALRFLAGGMGIPFIPTKSGLGTDIVCVKGFGPGTRQEKGVASQKLTVMENPFGDPQDRVIALPSLTPDVAIIHAQYVGEDGTVRIQGLTFADTEEAKSAGAVIVTCEEILPASFIRLNPDVNCLPPFLVDAIVCVPYGAHPTACHYFYDYDAQHLNMYKSMAGDDDRFQEYLDTWVFEVPNHTAYMDKLGGAKVIELRANPAYGYAPGIDRR